MVEWHRGCWSPWQVLLKDPCTDLHRFTPSELQSWGQQFEGNQRHSELSSPLWKTVHWYLWNLLFLSYNPVIKLAGVNDCLYLLAYMCWHVHNSQILDKLKCPSTNKLCCETLHSNKKTNKQTNTMDVNCNTDESQNPYLKRSQIQKNTYCVLPFIWSSETGKK